MIKEQIHSTFTAKEVIDRYFLENRAKLIDLAAFLDRIDRAAGNEAPGIDYRLRALFSALDVLTDGRANRAGRVLEIFSDDSTELPQSADGVKSATGAANNLKRCKVQKCHCERSEAISTSYTTERLRLPRPSSMTSQ